jgi:molybdate transport system regulatory protein
MEAGPRDTLRSGKHVLGRGLAALLAGVEAAGSLTKAAAAAGMSYRYAWHLVHQAEENLGQPMLVARSGGKRGGGSVLSPVGRRLLTVFETLSADVAAFAARRLDELMRETHHDVKRDDK